MVFPGDRWTTTSCSTTSGSGCVRVVEGVRVLGFCAHVDDNCVLEGSCQVQTDASKFDVLGWVQVSTLSSSARMACSRKSGSRLLNWVQRRCGYKVGICLQTCDMLARNLVPSHSLSRDE